MEVRALVVRAPFQKVMLANVFLASKNKNKVLTKSAKIKQDQPKDRQAFSCKHHFLKRRTKHQRMHPHAERFSSLRRATTNHTQNFKYSNLVH